MKPTRGDILQALEEDIGYAGGPKLVTDAIYDVLSGRFKIGGLEALERSEKLAPAILHKIRTRHSKSLEAGSISVLGLNSVSARYIQGSCFSEAADDIPTTKAKQNRSLAVEIHEAMRSLTFSQFERFGARVLGELGAQDCSVTPHSGDQGIDFYGVLSIGAVTSPAYPFHQLADDIELRFAGQAKHYPNSSISPAVLREVLGSVALARYNIFTSRESPFADFGILAFNPVVTMVFTTGRFSTASIKLAKDAGVLARSGFQLAVFLADRGVGVNTSDGNAIFDHSAFREWLDRDS